VPTDPRKRQKKLEHRAAKRQDKKRHLVRAQSAGLGVRLTTAAKAPVLNSWITEDLWTKGIGWVLLSRTLPNGLIAVVVFLVDRYCLGVKNAMADIVNHSTYESQLVRKMRSQFSSREVSPATARKVVEAAVAYARDLGLAPHPDYHKAKLLFGSIDPSESTEEMEFGKDGKPLFIPGPDETPQRSQQIISILTNRCGHGGFHCIVPMGGHEMKRIDAGDIQESALDFDEES
jgi:hypothetical protein